MAQDWTEIQKKYSGLWVAFADDEETVVATGKSAREALRGAQEKGCAEPTLAHMPAELTAYVGGGV